MSRSKYFGAALIGLLVVAAISVAAGSGRKPPKEQGATVSVRQLSGSEVMSIIHQFPEMLPSYFAEQKNDTGFLKTLFPFSEVTSASLGRAFPGVRFYKGTDFGRTEGGSPYLIGIAGEKRYIMPGGFNHLLLDGSQKVTDENVIEMAKTFVIFAVGSERRSFPEIAFSEAKRTCLKTGLPTEDAAILRVKTGERTETWHFTVLRGQFEGAARVNEKGLIKDFPAAIVESLPGRGQLNPSRTWSSTLFLQMVMRIWNTMRRITLTTTSS